MPELKLHTINEPSERSYTKKKSRRKTSESESLGNRYDALMAERADLQVKLTQYDLRDFSGLFIADTVPKAEMRVISMTWLSRVRQQTDFLAPLDSLGINVFAEDLQNQPGFPDHTIIFGSKAIQKRNVLTFSSARGQAELIKPKIELLLPKPTLKYQLGTFLHTGVMDECTGALVHELTHRHHLRVNSQTDGIMTEAQAYFTEIYSLGTNFSMTDIAKKLTRKLADGGSYGYNTDLVIDALRAMATLYGLGMSYAEVSALIIQSHYDPRRNVFVPLTDIINEQLKQRHLDDVDSQALDDLYRLRANNERRKAQLLLFETLAEVFPVAAQRVERKKALKTTLGIPTYYDSNGKSEMPDKDFGQRVYSPNNEQFPYDPNGLRTGIVFGLFPKKTEKGTVHEYRIGRWEAQNNQSKVVLAESLETTQSYLKILKQNSGDIKFIFKHELFWDCVTSGAIGTPDAQSVLRALCSDEEGAKLVTDMINGDEERFSLVRAEVNKLSRTYWPPHTPELLAKYRQNIAQIASFFEEVCHIFDLNFQELAQNLISKTNELTREIDQFTTLIHINEKLDSINIALREWYEMGEIDFKNYRHQITELQKSYTQLGLRNSQMERLLRHVAGELDEWIKKNK